MKFMTASIGLLVISALFYGCWSVAYNRGFNRGFNKGFNHGAREELACWELDPVLESDGSVQVFVGRRDLSVPLGGKKKKRRDSEDPEIYIPPSPHHPVNAIPSEVFPLD